MSIEAMKQALEALLRVKEEFNIHFMGTAITALRTAIEAAEKQELAANKMTAERAAYFMDRFRREEKLLGPNEQAAVAFVIDMLTTPPAAQRQWVGLTDEEAEKCRRGTWQATFRAIGALLREKNGGKA